MRTLLLAPLLAAVLAVAPSANANANENFENVRDKRTLGIIFRGLVDAQSRTTPPPPRRMHNDKTARDMKAPPATVYLIPVPERDKKTEAQLFNVAQTLRANATRNILLAKGYPLPQGNQIQPGYSYPPPSQFNHIQSVNLEKRNSSLLDPKQFFIRIAGDEGKAIMIRITGDDVKVKKSNDGYMIGIDNQDSKASVAIQLPDKKDIKAEQILPNYLQIDPFSLYKNQQSGTASQQDLRQQLYPVQPTGVYSGVYPSPYFLTPGFLPQVPFQYPAADPAQQATKQKEVEPAKAPQVHLTLKLKDGLEIKQTGHSGSGSSQNSLTQNEGGYHYQEPNPIKYQEQPKDNSDQQYHQQQQQQVYQEQAQRYQQQLQAARYQEQLRYQEQGQRYTQQQQQTQQQQRYNQYYPWYLQPPSQQQQQPSSAASVPQGAAHSANQASGWNYASYTPYPSYLQDTLAPPYLSNFQRFQRTPRDTHHPSSQPLDTSEVLASVFKMSSMDEGDMGIFRR